MRGRLSTSAELPNIKRVLVNTHAIKLFQLWCSIEQSRLRMWGAPPLVGFVGGRE